MNAARPSTFFLLLLFCFHVFIANTNRRQKWGRTRNRRLTQYLTWSLVLVMWSSEMMHPPDEVPGFWVSAGHKQSLNDVYLLWCWLETTKKKKKKKETLHVHTKHGWHTLTPLVRNSQHFVTSHPYEWPYCSNIKCINILWSNFHSCKFAWNALVWGT